MACRVVTVSREDYVNVVDLSDNIINRYILPYIALTEDKHLKQITCNALYEEIIDQITNNTLTPANEALLAKVKPYVVFKSYERYLAHANVYSTPSGIRTYNEEDSSSATQEQISALISLANEDAMVYESELKNFLDANKADYPLYEGCGCKSEYNTGKFNVSKVGKRQRSKRYFDSSYPDERTKRRDDLYGI
jgi:hypothetical protein